jgi:hypothetical protein
MAAQRRCAAEAPLGMEEKALHDRIRAGFVHPPLNDNRVRVDCF